jgi:hypothetical protein
VLHRLVAESFLCQRPAATKGAAPEPIDREMLPKREGSGPRKQTPLPRKMKESDPKTPNRRKAKEKHPICPGFRRRTPRPQREGLSKAPLRCQSPSPHKRVRMRAEFPWWLGWGGSWGATNMRWVNARHWNPHRSPKGVPRRGRQKVGCAFPCGVLRVQEACPQKDSRKSTTGFRPNFLRTENKV